MYHAQIAKNQFIYIRYYDRSRDKAKDFTLEQLDSNRRMVAKLTAEYADWNKEKGKWDLSIWTDRKFNVDGTETFTKGVEKDTLINLSPKDFKQRKGTVETMDINELSSFIEKEKLAGSSNINSYLIEKYKRFSFPFSSFVLTLIGASLASRKIRGGLGMHIAFGLLLAFSYILFMQLTSEFSIKGGLDPMMASWIPNIIYLIIGLILYRNAPK
jgi:lipopolysaccharide export system permease protein